MSQSDHQPQNRHYQLIASAIAFFAQHQAQQPSLAQLAAHVGLSECHLQRVFSEWVGVSPKQFLKFLTKQEAKRRLQQQSVLGAALDCGLSGAGRLHDLMISCEGMTPGQYKQQGAGLVIAYGVHATPFGGCLLAQTPRGICKLGFFDEQVQQAQLLEELQRQWGQAQLQRDDAATGLTLAAIFPERVQQDLAAVPRPRLHLLLKGSPFQLQVWEALLRIPSGQICSYQSVATGLDAPNAVRAVASAVANNPIGFLIPCHRVIRSTGEFNQYRWGPLRKQAMIGWEACQ